MRYHHLIMDPTAFKRNYLKGWVLFGLILGIQLILSWVIVRWDLDRSIVSRFYSDTDGWYLAQRQPWIWLYKYGTIPGILLAVTALVSWLVCLSKAHLHHLQRYLLVIVLAAILGPGVIINGILKNYWSRPRPRQIQEFGGQWPYRDMFQPGAPGQGQSFPCGHCSMGFLFCTLIVFRRNNAMVAYLGGMAGLVLGGFLSATRVLQGAHFPSDTLWSLAIVLLIMVLLYYIVFKIPLDHTHRIHKMPSFQARIILAVCIGAAIVMTVGFLMHRPFYRDHHIPLNIPEDVSQIHIKTNSELAKLNVLFADNRAPQLLMNARGFAWINARHHLRRNIHYAKRVLVIDLVVSQRGYFAELTHEVTVIIPKIFEDQIDLKLMRL